MDTDLPAEVTLAGLAAGPDKQVKVKYSKGTCTVYCHGATLSGGSLTVPQWEKGSSQAKCGTCHGLPPKDGHPASTSCSGCHDKVVDSANKIKAPALHINGKVESSAACNSCHGSKASPAPPVDTKGNSDTSSRGVGAHQAHVRSGANHIALPCSECHVLPKSLTDKGHNNGTAEVVFGKLAKGELRTTPPGLKPSWDTTGLTCKSTYCHELDGGGNPAPAWTKGQKMVCGSCHGLPPAKTLEGKTHVASSLAQCTTCHSSVVDAAGKITAPKLHVNGKVDQ